MTRFCSLDVVVKVRKRLAPPFRPDIPKESDGYDQRYLQLMYQCWDDEPSKRPIFNEVKSSLRAINNSK